MNLLRLAVLAAGALLALSASAGEPQRVRVMSFNAWGGGANDGTGPAATIEAIRLADADFVGLQETRAEASQCSAEDCPAEGPSFASHAAEALDYHQVRQVGDAQLVWAQAILSRHPPVREIPGGLGAEFDVGGRRIAMFNLHFTDYPYQPYQAAGIPYGEAPFLAQAEDLIAAAVAARGGAVQAVVAAVEALGPADLVLVTGDFNEPSHRDWTEATARARRHPLAVAFPTVLRFEQLGFVDAYRAVHPDALAHPGYTWTPTRPLDDPGEHHDRIDFVLLRGEGARVAGAWVVGESAAMADIVVRPWPSDHRAVVVEIMLGQTSD